jgi:hypothetical protein
MTANNFDEALIALSNACIATINSVTADMDEDARANNANIRDAEEVGRVVGRIIRAETKDQVAHRNVLYRAFGSPGDWGYNHPIGKALRDLYQMKLGPIAEANS